MLRLSILFSITKTAREEFPVFWNRRAMDSGSVSANVKLVYRRSMRDTCVVDFFSLLLKT